MTSFDPQNKVSRKPTKLYLYNRKMIHLDPQNYISGPQKYLPPGGHKMASLVPKNTIVQPKNDVFRTEKLHI